MFSLYELALDQEMQDRLRNENEEILSKYDGNITYDAIMEMKYLDMVFNETLRKYPVVDTQFRTCSKDFKIPNSNLTIPKNTMILLSSQALHHDDRFWKNPSQFDPERFSDENVKQLNQFSYIPFSKFNEIMTSKFTKTLPQTGEGPRICIGSRFGIMQTKIALVKLLREYRFSSCPKTTIPMAFEPSAAFQSPVGGMWLTVESIN